jgi:catalase
MSCPLAERAFSSFALLSVQFVFVNDKGVRTFFKAHWRPHLGVHGLAWDECLKLNGVDPDFHRRDLYDNIAAGNFPKWDFGVQCVSEVRSAPCTLHY